MDKAGKTITIKINGKNQKIKEEQTTDRSVQNIQNQDDKALLSELKSHNQESAAAEEKVEESFDWILPENKGTEDIKEYKIESYPKKKKPSLNTSIKKKLGRNKNILTTIFFTVFFAVLLGTSFGVIILKLVTTEQPPTEQVAGPVSPTTGEDDKESPSTGEKVSVKAGAILTNIVQQGVYSTKDNADSVAAGLQENGLPAKTIKVNGQFFVWVGVADTIDGAKLLGTQIESEEFDPFSKPIELQEKTVEVTQQEANLLEAIPDLFANLSAAASSAILSEKASDDVISSIIKTGEAFKKVEQEELSNENVKLLHQTVNSSVEKIENYKGSGDPKQLSSLQIDLLTILSVYQAL